MMHTCAVQLLTNTGSEVAWIDFTVDFSINLFMKVIDSHLNTSVRTQSHPSLSSILDRVKVYRVFDTDGLIEALDEIRDGHKEILQERTSESTAHGVAFKDNELRCCGVRLIVVNDINQKLSLQPQQNHISGMISSLLLHFPQFLMPKPFVHRLCSSQ